MDPLEPVLDWLIKIIPQEKLKAQLEKMGLGKGCSAFLVGGIVVASVLCCMFSCWLVLWMFGLLDDFS
ncbi:MAG TPA: hypothetical protein PLI75_19995 [Anaerolineales bacterium]|nr:hypothetical protein [Anaerolineales bacterium]